MPQRWNIYCLTSVANRYILHMLQILTADLDAIRIYNLEIVDFQTLNCISDTVLFWKLWHSVSAMMIYTLDSGSFILTVWKFYQKIIFQHFCFIQHWKLGKERKGDTQKRSWLVPWDVLHHLSYYGAPLVLLHSVYVLLCWDCWSSVEPSSLYRSVDPLCKDVGGDQTNVSKADL